MIDVEKYYSSGLLALFTVKVAEVFRFLPEPDTFAQAAILALATGFLGGVGRWISERWLKRKSKQN